MSKYIWEMRRKSDSVLVGILQRVRLMHGSFWWECTFKPTGEFKQYESQFNKFEEILQTDGVTEEWIDINEWMMDTFDLSGIHETPNYREFALYINDSQARVRGLFEDE